MPKFRIVVSQYFEQVEASNLEEATQRVERHLKNQGINTDDLFIEEAEPYIDEVEPTPLSV